MTSEHQRPYIEPCWVLTSFIRCCFTCYPIYLVPSWERARIQRPYFQSTCVRARSQLGTNFSIVCIYTSLLAGNELVPRVTKITDSACLKILRLRSPFINSIQYMTSSFYTIFSLQVTEHRAFTFITRFAGLSGCQVICWKNKIC